MDGPIIYNVEHNFTVKFGAKSFFAMISTEEVNLQGHTLIDVFSLAYKDSYALILFYLQVCNCIR